MNPVARIKHTTKDVATISRVSILSQLTLNSYNLHTIEIKYETEHDE